MTNAVHTPGPRYTAEQTRIEAIGYGMIDSVRGEVSRYYETAAEAYARLLAAAPNLLAALQAVADWCATPSDSWTTSDIEDVVFDALARATGAAHGIAA